MQTTSNVCQLYPQCQVDNSKELQKEKACERSRKWYKDNREQAKATSKKWREKNKESIKERTLLWYKEHREERIEYLHNYYQENKERLLEQQKQYHQAHKKHRNKQAIEYRKENKDAVYKKIEEWHDNHPEKRFEIQQRYRARKKNAKGEFRAEDITRMAELQEHKCLRCGEEKPLTVDHIVPLSQGGDNFLENLQLLCQSCNSKKHVNTKDYRSKALKKLIFDQQELFQ